jgi:hypothetical protein
MAQVGLQRPRVVSLVRKSVAARVPKHVRVSRRCDAMRMRQALLGELSLSCGIYLTTQMECPGGAQNPASGISVPADVQRNRFLDKDETKRLVEALATDENQVAANDRSTAQRDYTSSLGPC